MLKDLQEAIHELDNCLQIMSSGIELILMNDAKDDALILADLKNAIDRIIVVRDSLISIYRKLKKEESDDT